MPSRALRAPYPLTWRCADTQQGCLKILQTLAHDAAWMITVSHEYMHE